LRNNIARLYVTVMLPLFTDLLDRLRELNQAGVDARLAWYDDADTDSMVLVEMEAENLGRLERWLEVAAEDPGAGIVARPQPFAVRAYRTSLRRAVMLGMVACAVVSPVRQ
jgi:hypothetical protein